MSTICLTCTELAVILQRETALASHQKVRARYDLDFRTALRARLLPLVRNEPIAKALRQNYKLE